MVVLWIIMMAVCTAGAQQQTYLCFKNNGAADDFHYYYQNKTQGIAGQVDVFQGFDLVVGQGAYTLSGTFNHIRCGSAQRSSLFSCVLLFNSNVYSFNTNQPDPAPATVYINQWGVSASGGYLPGFLYGLAQSNFTANPITLQAISSTFSDCPPRIWTATQVQNLFLPRSRDAGPYYGLAKSRPQ